MRTTVLAMAVILSFQISGLPAQAADPAPAVGAPAPAAAEQRPDQWRYKWHNNQWWYYTPKEQWLVYQGDAWQPYTAPPANMAPQPTYYSAPAYRSSPTYTPGENPAHSLGATGNYPRYWLWKRLGQ